LSTDQTDTFIRPVVEHAFNQGRFAVVDELLAVDSITHIPSWGIPHTREGLKQLITLFRSAFPDLQCIVEDEISVGDRIAAHWMLLDQMSMLQQLGIVPPPHNQLVRG
jgi:hypothetical protein